MTTEKEETKTDTISVARIDSDLASAENGSHEQPEPRRPMATKRALIAWLVLCFSVRYLLILLLLLLLFLFLPNLSLQTI